MRVDFYILRDSGQRREMMACRLCEKAYAQGQNVFILADSPQQARELDTLLWTFRDGGFLPHRLLDQAAADTVPAAILIGWEDPGEIPGYPVLLNLATEAPAFYRRFERIAEIVSQAPDIKAAGRNRFAFYREQGCNPQHHEV
jgi:DNA polymerase-3 subunit chi